MKFTKFNALVYISTVSLVASPVILFMIIRYIMMVILVKSSGLKSWFLIIPLKNENNEYKPSVKHI